jgi:Fe-S oxidoreductase
VLRDDACDIVDGQWSEIAELIATRTITVDEWLDECRTNGLFERLSWDHQPREILYHGHCHQKALWGTSASRCILDAIPHADVVELDAGCCGMAGSFGYEKEHYAVSVTIAEQRLWPAVRQAPEAMIAANGTSCREQIGHIDREAYHPVEIVAMACGWSRSV